MLFGQGTAQMVHVSDWASDSAQGSPVLNIRFDEIFGVVTVPSLVWQRRIRVLYRSPEFDMGASQTWCVLTSEAVYLIYV